MLSSLVKSMPIVGSIIVMQFLIYMVDRRYGIIEKINNFIPIEGKWKVFIWYIIVLFFIIGVTLLRAFVINIPALIYKIINGCAIGFGISMAFSSMIKRNFYKK